MFLFADLHTPIINNECLKKKNQKKIQTEHVVMHLAMLSSQ